MSTHYMRGASRSMLLTIVACLAVKVYARTFFLGGDEFDTGNRLESSPETYFSVGTKIATQSNDLYNMAVLIRENSPSQVTVQDTKAARFGGHNFAHAASLVRGGDDGSSLADQVEALLGTTNGKLKACDLIVISTGTNDQLNLPEYTDFIVRGPLLLEYRDLFLAVVVNDMVDIIQQLIDAGAGKVLLYNMPDLGRWAAWFEQLLEKYVRLGYTKSVVIDFLHLHERFHTLLTQFGNDAIASALSDLVLDGKVEIRDWWGPMQTYQFDNYCPKMKLLYFADKQTQRTYDYRLSNSHFCKDFGCVDGSWNSSEYLGLEKEDFCFASSMLWTKGLIVDFNEAFPDLFNVTGAANLSVSEASCNGDPHLHFAHGGTADFRGQQGQFYNFLSASNVSFNIRTETADFRLGEVLVHGTFMTEGHLVLRTSGDRLLKLSLWASEIGPQHFGWRAVNGSCAKRRVLLGPHAKVQCDDIYAYTDYATLHVETLEWSLSLVPQPVYDRISGPAHRIDIRLTAKTRDFSAPPHGLVGQSFVQERREGRLDMYPSSGEFTTSAMAEGAIDGVAADYEVDGPLCTDFTFSRFEAGTSPAHHQPHSKGQDIQTGLAAAASDAAGFETI